MIPVYQLVGLSSLQKVLITVMMLQITTVKDLRKDYLIIWEKNGIGGNCSSGINDFDGCLNLIL
jgi:hypothetical protein